MLQIVIQGKHHGKKAQTELMEELISLRRLRAAVVPQGYDHYELIEELCQVAAWIKKNSWLDISKWIYNIAKALEDESETIRDRSQQVSQSAWDTGTRTAYLDEQQ